MRLIGHLRSEPGARRFSDHLYAEGIDNAIEPEANGSWAVWIHSEDDLEEARRRLARFESNPDAPEYQSAPPIAAERREKEEKEQEEYRKRFRTREQIWRQGPARLTMALIVASGLVFLFSDMGANRAVFYWFVFLVPEIMQGQVWRVITPILFHLSLLHILFNMLWLHQLGSLVERRHGTLLFAGMVATIGIGSNLAQYLHTGPAFGGMSGVVYGLLGYVWLRGRLDPHCGYYVDRFVMTFMMVWFAMGWMQTVPGLPGLGLPRMANMAHTAGLLLGLAWGWIMAQRQFR